MKSSENKDEKLINAYLALESFEEYLGKYADFANLPRSPKVFEKTMKLMEPESGMNRRKKEQMLLARKNQLLKDSRAELEKLKEQISREGVWIYSKRWPKTVEVTYTYPDGKRGDVDFYILGKLTEYKEKPKTSFKGKLSTDYYHQIALVELPRYRPFSGGLRLQQEFSQEEAK